MDHWKKFNKTSLPGKGGCYSNLNMEDISDTAYVHPKIVCKENWHKKIMRIS